MNDRAALAGVILLTTLSAACASHAARPEPFPRTGEMSDKARGRTGEGPGPTAEIAGSVLDLALALQGRPYAAGGSGPDRFDCSGFVQYVFGQHDIPLPRTVAEQFEATRAIDVDAAHAGDLLFFRMSGRRPSHVGIALGDGRFVHAPSGRGVVRVESLASSYWRKRFESARRVR
jgi:cell wall-associated NlpC family hydrolase